MAVQPLRSVESATSVRVRGAETEITDGPFAMTKEVDRLRRDRSVADRAERLAELTRPDARDEESSMDDESTIVDDRLRLIRLRTDNRASQRDRSSLGCSSLAAANSQDLRVDAVAQEPSCAEPGRRSNACTSSTPATERRLPRWQLAVGS